jgi:hypothetical protein
MKNKPLAIVAVGLLLGTSPAQAGPVYWSLFNIEGENSLTANYVTYATLTDMLGDTNRLGVFVPDSVGFGRNIVGSGASVMGSVVVPEPTTGTLFSLGLLGLGLARRRKPG